MKSRSGQWAFWVGELINRTIQISVIWMINHKNTLLFYYNQSKRKLCKLGLQKQSAGEDGILDGCSLGHMVFLNNPTVGAGSKPARE